MYDQKLVADYLRKCFVSVDGLWFMKVEEDSDFEKALDLDIAVWRVLPKIEARTIQGLINTGEGIDGLQRALEFKLSAELFRFELSPLSHEGFDLDLCDCPWVCHIKKANRQQFLDRISESICSVEYQNFVNEFGRDITVEHDRGRCRSDGCCSFHFQTLR
jgi:hypothetical protein